jgi:oligopeptide transport system ATP-binding protein
MLEHAEPILSLRNLRVHFPIKNSKRWPWQPPKTLKAVDGVSFDLYAGETLGIVGESGCGKSTLSRAIAQLLVASAGEIIWLGRDLRHSNAQELAQMRQEIQMIFQDPLASLNPRMTVSQIIEEPLRVHRPALSAQERMQCVKRTMAQVGLRAQTVNRYPHEFSGGQCQRIGIARALILQPRLIMCDEPVSALDVSIQAQIINLLKTLQREMGLALLFIAHDLAVVKHISDRILVMYLGREMELAEKNALYAHPAHPYTRRLIRSTPHAAATIRDLMPDDQRLPLPPTMMGQNYRVLAVAALRPDQLPSHVTNAAAPSQTLVLHSPSR